MLDKKCITIPVRDFLPNLAEMLIRYGDEQGKDLKDFIVILPNRRSGVYLRYFLSNKLQSATLSPDIYSLEDFIDYYYENYLNSDTKISIWDACYFLFEIFGNLKFKGKKLFDNFWNFVPYGIKIFQDFEELKIFQISPQELERVIAFLDIAEDSRISVILQSYPGAYKTFYEALQGKGYSTRSLRYYLISQNIGEEAFFEGKEVFFCPPYLVSKSESLIIKSLLKRDNFHLLLQEIPLAQFDFLDFCESVKIESGSPCENIKLLMNSQDIELIPTEDDVSEVLILRDRLSELNDHELNTVRTGIVLPDGGKLATVLELGIPDKVREFNVSMGYPAGYSNAYIFLRDLVEFFKLLQDKDGDFVINLRKLSEIISRDIVACDGQPLDKLCRTLDKLIEMGYTLMRRKDLESILLKTGSSNAEEVILEWQKVYEGFVKRILNSRRFGEVVQTLIDFYSGSGDLPVKYKLKADVEGVLHSIIEELLGLKHSLISEITSETDGPRLIVDYLEFISLVIKNLSVPLKGTPLKGLQVIGFLETRLLTFDTLFILDVQEYILPKVEREGDRILPLDIRTELGLFDLRQREKLTEALFFSLIGAAKKCILIYKDTRTEEPSHLLLILKECLENKVKEQQHTTFYHSGTVSFKKTFNFEKGVSKTDEMIEKLRSMTFSYTAIETYLICPLKFLFMYVLGIEEELEDEYDVRRLGSVIHKILERFFKEAKGEVKSEDLIKDSLVSNYFHKIAEEVLDEAYPVDTPRIKLMKEGIKVRLRNSLCALQRELENKIKSEKLGTFIGYEVEQEIRTKINVDSSDVDFMGKIDRLDVYSNAYIVLDYKSSTEVDRYKKGLEISEILDSLGSDSVARTILTPYIQLPIYYWLLLKKNSLETKENDFKVFVCVAPMKSKSPEIVMKSYSLAEGLEEKVEDIIKKIISEIINPETRFYPPEQKKRKESCKNCSFRLACKVI
ncbi:MAG: PD-(D/E)XK nuclease family protein [candidate division WOR-3 bacterium]